MKANTANILARLRLPGTAALDTSSHDTPKVMQPANPLRRLLTGLAAAVAVLGMSQPAAHANGTPYYFDVDGDTPGFGEPSGSYDMNASALWSTDPTGSSATAAFDPTWDPGVQWTFGDPSLDFAGTPPFTFTINANGAADWFRINGIAVNSPNADITLSGANMINANQPGTTWSVAVGSSLTVNGNYGGIGGLNWGGNGVNFAGGGTFNFVTAVGLLGNWINQSGPVVNLQAASTIGAWGTVANYTLTAGTLNFATTDAAGAFAAYGNNNAAFTINGGTIDNTSLSAMTLDLNGGLAGQGIIKLGGDFTFTGTDDLDFGTAPVELTATPQITVVDNNLTIGGIISGSGLGLTKAGTGTLTLDGANSYDGDTTVSAGILSISNAYLANASTVTIASDATLDLNFAGTDSVTALVIGTDPPLADGVYKSSTNTIDPGTPLPQLTGTGTLTVAGLVATTTVLANPNTNPSTYGDSLSFDVTVSGGTPAPSGTVTLQAGATTLGSETLTASGTDGICTITTTTLAVTHDPIVAVYSGDTTYAGSTSDPLDPDQTVNPATPIVTVTGPTSFTYNSNPQGPNTATTGGSTGAVTFSYEGTGSTTYGPIDILPTEIGTYTCTATVAADANYLSASSVATAFTIDPPIPPPNDNFADAIALTGDEPGQTGDATGGTQTGTDNIDATQEAGEPVGSGGTSTVWFKWTCTTSGNFTIRTSGSTALGGGEWDAVLGIYTGTSVDALTPLGTTPQDTVLEETMTLTVAAGTTYYIQTAGYGNGLAENIVLTWSWIPLSTACDMVTFGPGAVITGTDIAWTVPYNTTVADLAPTFTMSPLAACNNQPNGGIPTPALSTTTPVTYTVTAQAGNTKDYAVLVTVAAPGLVIGKEQYNAGVGVAGPPAPIDCVSGDLLEMSGVVADNELNALWRSGIYNDGVAYYGDNSTAVLTYTLDLASNPAGYDIQEIRAFSGWDSNRSGQSYDLSYSLVGTPDTFVALGTILTGERNGAVMTRTYHTGGAAILTGVAKIRFTIQPTNGGGGTFPPGEGYGTVWREFDVLGTPTGGTGTPYDTWLAGYTFASGADTTPTGDPDGDSLTNQQEFAFGLDPTSGASVSPVTPLIGTQFTYTRYAASGLGYTVEFSTDLAGWDTAAWTDDGGGTVDPNGVQIVTVTVTNTPVNGKLFVRVRAE